MRAPERQVNDLLLLEDHEGTRVLEVVVKLGSLVLALAPGVDGARLHRQPTDELAAADSNDLIAVENAFLLVGGQLIRCRLRLLDVAEA